jgi:hypothetical protein
LVIDIAVGPRLHKRKTLAAPGEGPGWFRVSWPLRAAHLRHPPGSYREPANKANELEANDLEPAKYEDEYVGRGQDGNGRTVGALRHGDRTAKSLNLCHVTD